MRVRNENVCLNFVCDEALQAAIRKAAVDQDRSMSSIVRAAVRAYLASAGDKKPKLRSETAA